jgi:tRNA-specific 2-thiouridylase
VRCNTFTKFRDLVHKADEIDAQWVATGHYARVVDGKLYRGLDATKDQSYFLWGIDRAVMQRLILPVGAQTKAETRAVARRLGLEVVADKIESQDICFVPNGDHTAVLRRRLGADAPALAAGPILSSDGAVVGRHNGFAHYTIGQRRGLPGGFSEPMYVVEIRPESRAVVIGPREALLGRAVIARAVNWLTDAPAVGDRVGAQVRHRAAPAAAEIVRLDDDAIELALDEPVTAITPGQSLVLYEGARVLGGAIIDRAPRASGRGGLPVLAA